MRRDFLTASNLLSILRVLLVVPFVAVMLSSQPSARVWGSLLVILAALTDKFDGVLARMFHQETEWGRILDPLADKIGVGAVVVVLVMLGDLPIWFAAAVLGRDFLILAGGMVLKARTGGVVQSNPAGKWAVGIIALFLLIRVSGVHTAILDGFAAVLMATSLLMLAVSLALYVARFAALLRSPRE